MVFKWLRSLFDGSTRGGHPPTDTPYGPNATADPLNPNATIYTYDAAPPPLPMAPTQGDALEAITAHVERHVGPITQVLHELASPGVHIDVLIVPPTDTQPCWTFVTCGMSDRPMTPDEGAEEHRHAELMIRLPRVWPIPDEADGGFTAWQNQPSFWPIHILKSLARYPHEHRTWLWFGHTVAIEPGGDALPDVRFNAALITPPFSLPEDFWTLEVSPEKTIHIFNILPLFPEELDFKRQHDLDDFLGRLPHNPLLFEILNPWRERFVEAS